MRMLEPRGVGQKMFGKNVKNIDIPEFQHQNFGENILIKKGKYKNKKLFDLYKEFLK